MGLYAAFVASPWLTVTGVVTVLGGAGALLLHVLGRRAPEVEFRSRLVVAVLLIAAVAGGAAFLWLAYCSCV
ncbi:MAG TPA: hypothetical protein VHJ34_11120 [Actinomycetota bacterium]|nr:hypothetical protein [Actinomycetota bacterium]